MMSQHSQHSQTNGASLEDCHTNFFTLTDLCGIKWRVFRHESPATGETDPLEDPILVSYSRCLSADVLCVWRRTWHATPGLDINGGLGGPISNHHHHHGLPNNSATSNRPSAIPLKNCPKELWVFWYRDEPDLSSLVSPELTKSEDNAGSFENGLSYECRTILFKALHNLIERCLLTRDFVRLGKWFIQPYDGPDIVSSKNTHLSFNLSFFVHGESTVCASVDVRQHPPVRRLSKKHILSAQQTPQGIPVILGPYGLKGSLTGVTYKNPDPQAQKVLDDWKKFFPLDSLSICSNNSTSSSSNSTSGSGLPSRESGSADGSSATTTSSTHASVPSLVEVLVGGNRLRYPSCYVLVTDMDEEHMPSVHQESSSTVLGGHTLLQNIPNSSATVSKECHSPLPGHESNTNIDDAFTKACLEELPPSTISPFTASTHTLLSSGYIHKGGKGLGWSREMGEHIWQDIVQCPGGSNNPSSSHYEGLTPEGSLSPAEVAGQWEFGDPAFKVICACCKSTGCNSINACNNFAGYKASSIATPGSVPSLRATGANDGPPPSVESPASITPSPLPMPRTPQSQPPSVPNHDPSLSLLSPHPPASNVSLGDPTTPAPVDSSDKCIGLDTSIGPKSTTSNGQVSSPYPSGNLDGSKHQPDETMELNPTADPSSSSSCTSSATLDVNGLLNPLIQPNLSVPLIDGSQHSSFFGNTPTVPARRPMLPESEYHNFSDLEGSLLNVYDNSRFTAWLQHPVKKFRPAEQKTEEPLWPPYRPTHMAQKFESITTAGVKVEHKMEVEGNTFMVMKKNGGIKRPATSDPYDFDDDPSTIDSFKVKDGKEDPCRSLNSIKPADQPQSLSPSRKNLFTIEGITPKVSDLDDIFDSPVDDYPVQTPPGSNKPLILSDDTGTVVANKVINTPANSKNGTSNSFELTQLTKMYPTPPSLDTNNPDHDPAEETSIPQTLVTLSIKQEVADDIPELSCVSKDEMDIDEPTLVYKPHLVSSFIGSDMYKPLIDLPSMEDKEILSISSDMMQSLKYNPSWQQFPTSDKTHSTPSRQNMPPLPPSHSNQAVFPINNSIAPLATSLLHVPNGPTSGPKMGMSPISPANPSALGDCALTQKGPASVGPPLSAGPSLNYELSSPASNQSSYLNRTLPSVEAPSSCAPSLQVPEANSLLTNVVLQDSSINLFRDHNFDSCTMCVCINGEKVVGSIRGSDGSLYLPPSHLSSEEEMFECKCGFSAVVNRKLGYQSGLFYEDEVDLTGLHEGLLNERKKPSLQSLLDNKNSDNSDRDNSNIDSIPQYIFDLVQSQSLVTLCTPSSVLHRAVSDHNSKPDCINLVEYKDGNEIALVALEQSRLDYTHQMHLGDNDYHHSLASTASKTQVMHRWCYIQFDGPACSQDMVSCMKALQPFLQEAIQKKRNTRLWEPVYNVSGLLTWRQFHRMAVRGTEDMAEPLPIPLLLTGHEKDWLSIAPQSIRNWEKLLLEPYSRSRNVAYVVVSPDNEFILNHVRAFFKELSSIYELCQLGKHAPIRRVLVDGIMRVSKRAAGKVANEATDDWFTLLGDSHIFTKLRIYSQICCHTLAPHLTTLSLDKSLFETNSRVSEQKAQQQQQVPSPMPPPPPGTTGSSANNGTSTSSNVNCSSAVPGGIPSQNGPEGEAHQMSLNSGAATVNNSSSGSALEVEDDDSPPPAIMVYLIDPFTMHQNQSDMQRLITLGLLRCYKAMLEKLPESMQSHVYVQIVSLETILELARESHDKSKRIDQLKSLAFSVFMQCRRILTHTSTVKSLTGFGPAAEFDSFLKPADLIERNLHPYQVFSPAYILAPIKESRGRHKEAEEALGDPKEKSVVLYCTYCLSEDQRWLLASATDELGEILETVSISIEIPNRTRRKKASSRRHGLKKLMDWLLGVMSIGVNPWRLVIGRLGRIGHGELKGWLSLLSRKSPYLSSKNLKELCKQCSYLFPGDAPCILSACLVSLEPDPSFRIMPDIFTPDERFGQNSQNCNLSTPQDVTCTHILVFPTSATAKTAHQINNDDNFGDNIFGVEDPIIETMGGDMGSLGLLGDMGDLFDDDMVAPQGIGHMEDGAGQQDSLSHNGSPISSGIIGAISSSQYSGQARSNGVVMVDPQEEFAGLLQQPLALGYYISTASTGKLPHSFWASCPHLEFSCPTFLKSALHINQPADTQADDVSIHHASPKVHPLDSIKTSDVLRHVLEGYNNLSWLVLDPATQDRRSCLPMHMQVLSHLYNLMASLI